MVSKEGKLVDQREMLRVKLKSLADEARIIRFEEARCREPLRAMLRWHRVDAVRVEARATVVAYGLIRGHPYERIEPGTKSSPPWDKVKYMVTRYGPTDAKRNAELRTLCDTIGKAPRPECSSAARSGSTAPPPPPSSSPKSTAGTVVRAALAKLMP